MRGVGHDIGVKREKERERGGSVEGEELQKKGGKGHRCGGRERRRMSQYFGETPKTCPGTGSRDVLPN